MDMTILSLMLNGLSPQTIDSMEVTVVIQKKKTFSLKHVLSLFNAIFSVFYNPLEVEISYIR